MKREEEKARDGTLFKTVSVGGRSFPIRYIYYEDEGVCYPDLPSFESSPQYTGEGRPFTLAVAEACGLVPRETDNCGCCGHFARGADGDPIGVCMNEKRRNRI